jgi:hypothetical protein
MLAILESLEEAKFSEPGTAVKLPKHGIPPRAVKHFKKAGEQQKVMMRVAHRAKAMGRPDAAALAVKKAREAGAELHGHRQASKERREKRLDVAAAKAGAMGKLRRKGSKVRAKIQKVVKGAKRAA